MNERSKERTDRGWEEKIKVKESKEGDEECVGIGSEAKGERKGRDCDVMRTERERGREGTGGEGAM